MRRWLEISSHISPVALRCSNEDVGRGQNSIQRVRQGDGELRSQKVNIHVQIAWAVDAEDHERTTAPVGSRDQVEGKLPGRLVGDRDHVRELAPVEGTGRINVLHPIAM